MKIQLEVPASLSEIKLGQYQHYMRIVDQNGEDAIDFVNKKLIEIFCDISLEQVDSIPLVEVNKVVSILEEAFKEKPNLIRHFKLLDVDMGFIPKLDDISLGEYIDLEANISDWQKIHKAMAVLYRPVNFKQKDKYTISPYKPSDDISEMMKEMPMDAVMSAMVFFYDLGKELSIATLNYMEDLVKKGKLTSQQKELLHQNGVGINQYMESLKETSSNLTKLQVRDYSSV
jgi:hypothetical protein